MSENLVSAAYAVGNVLSSVAIVLVNKKVFAAGFHFPFTLSFFHFCFTVVFYKFLHMCGLFSIPEPDIPQSEKFKIGLVGFASIGLMNVSLSLNSVGFYQVLCAPIGCSARLPAGQRLLYSSTRARALQYVHEHVHPCR